MSRAILSLIVITALPTLARADRPIVQAFTDGGSYDAPAGTLCDFNYREVGSLKGVQQLFFDDGNLVLVRVHISELDVLHVNLDTGASFEERAHVNQTFDLESGTATFDGLWWDLPNGTKAGRFVAAPDGTIVFETPNMGASDAAQILCSTLGGNPA